MVVAPKPPVSKPTKAVPNMVKCQRCGSENPETLKFCNSCGAPMGYAYAQPPVPAQMAPPMQMPPPMPMMQAPYPVQPRVTAMGPIMSKLTNIDMAVFVLGLFVVLWGIVGASYLAEHHVLTRDKVAYIFALILGGWAAIVGAMSLLGMKTRR